MADARAEHALKTLVIVMGVVLVVGFGVVAAVIVGRVARSGPAARPFAAAPVAIPPGTRIETMAFAGDRLAVAVAQPSGGHQIIVFDLASGKPLGTLSLQSSP